MASIEKTVKIGSMEYRVVWHSSGEKAGYEVFRVKPGTWVRKTSKVWLLAVAEFDRLSNGAQGVIVAEKQEGSDE